MGSTGKVLKPPATLHCLLCRCLTGSSNAMRFLGIRLLCVVIATVALFGGAAPSALFDDQRIMRRLKAVDFLVGRLEYFDRMNEQESGEFAFMLEQILELTESMKDFGHLEGETRREMI